MKIAICFRGKHFDVYDYRNCFSNINENLIQPLSENNEVDIFCLLYDSHLTESLLNDYKPKKCHILNHNDQYNGSQWDRQIIFHKLSVEIIKNYEIENNIKYDIVINLRYDLFFKVNINNWNIDFNKILIGFKHTFRKHEVDHVDDNIFIIPRKYLDDFSNSINLLSENNKITHEVHIYINSDYINYIYDMENFGDWRLFDIFRHKNKHS